jgi:hypothetical protein
MNKKLPWVSSLDLKLTQHPCDEYLESFITIYVYGAIKHCRSLLSWPILYNSPFFGVKGLFFLPITRPQCVMFSKILSHPSAI